MCLIWREVLSGWLGRYKGIGEEWKQLRSIPSLCSLLIPQQLGKEKAVAHSSGSNAAALSAPDAVAAQSLDGLPARTVALAAEANRLERWAERFDARIEALSRLLSRQDSRPEVDQKIIEQIVPIQLQAVQLEEWARGADARIVKLMSLLRERGRD